MIPHPFDRFRRSRITEEALMRILPQVDILEVFNARTALGWDNRRAEKLASAHGLVAAVGSDSHTAQELGHAYVEMADFDSPQTFLDSLRCRTSGQEKEFMARARLHSLDKTTLAVPVR